MPKLTLPLSAELLEKLKPLLYYVNVSDGSGSELKPFCNKHDVPTKIHIEDPTTGRATTTKDTDRKAIVLDRVIKYLETGMMPPPTIFPSTVVNFASLPKSLKSTDKVFYGQYKNVNAQIEAVVLPLTGGISPFCAMGQETIRKFWSEGIAPTYAEFAKAFLAKQKAHKTSDNPEWAYLNDLGKANERGEKLNKSEWRTKIRPTKAQEALKILDQIEISKKRQRSIDAFFPTEKSSIKHSRATRFSDNRSLTFFPKENKNNTKKMQGLSLKSEPTSLT